MKKFNLLLIITTAVFAMSLSSCKKDEKTTEPDPEIPLAPNEIVLKGDYATSKTLDPTKTYILKGKVYFQLPAVLTIPAGTIVKVDKATQGTLIINRGAKLVANGTAAKPIVFTSSAPAGFRNRGDWGGVIMLGNAENNKGTNVTIEGISAAVGENGLHGAGSAAAINNQNSGSLKFVRIEYAGIPLNDDNELNSLTLGSIGSGTTFENIMISYANDDAYEWFGGSADAKYLISFSAWDDDFDTDLGFSGKVQFGFVLREPNIADKSGSRVWESSSSSVAALPTSMPVFSNVTVLGPLVYGKNSSTNEVNPFYRACIEVNSNSAIKIHNSIMLGHADQINTSTPGAFAVNNCVASFEAVAGTGNFAEDSLKDVFGAAFSGKALVPNGTAGATNNTGYKTNAVLGYTTANPAPVLDASSPYISGAPSVAAFATTPSYYGAFGTTPDAGWEWTEKWVDFTPNNNTY